jgi:hypothetical protein
MWSNWRFVYWDSSKGWSFIRGQETATVLIEMLRDGKKTKGDNVGHANVNKAKHSSAGYIILNGILMKYNCSFIKV